MTSLDFKGLLKRERAKLQRQEQQENEGQNRGSTNKTPRNPPLTLAPRSRLDLSALKVSGPVDGIHYLPGWLSEEDAQQLLEAIDQVRTCKNLERSVESLCVFISAPCL